MSLKKRVCALLLCVLLSVGVFSGCDISQVCISSPTLTLYGEYPYQLPLLKGFSGAHELSEQLAEHYEEICSLLRTANSDNNIAAINYTLTKKEDLYVLGAYIVGRESGSMLLEEIEFDLKGKTDIPPVTMGEYISSGDFLTGYFLLESLGMEPDMARCEEYTDAIELLEIIVRYSEAMTKPIDITKISQTVSGSDVYLKAYEAGFTTYEDESDLLYDLSSYDIAEIFSSFYKYASSHICATSSNEATVQELVSLCDVFLAYYDVIIDSDVSFRWKNTRERIIENCIVDGEAVPATRSSTAQTFVEAFEAEFGEITNDRYDWITYTDTELEDALKASSEAMMNSFPSSDIFSPQYIIHDGELAETAARFASACYERFCSEIYEEYSYIETGVTYADLICYIGELDIYIKNHTMPDAQSVTVCNDRDYDWYLTQYDYSYYADVNCMPTISAMAIRWYTGDMTVTQHTLREKFLPEYRQGWWMWQVEECLADYGVKYESKDLSLDSILSDLDAGCIILSQMSEADLSRSGHCFIIYGYRRLGNSIVFLVHDPGVSYERNKYDEPIGKGMELDSSYAYWTIDRFAYSYVAVSNPS